MSGLSSGMRPILTRVLPAVVCLALSGCVTPQSGRDSSSGATSEGSVESAKVDEQVALAEKEAEALQALGAMSKNASAGKVIPNFIVKNPDMGKKMLTLSLSNIPMTDVIDYLARMSGVFGMDLSQYDPDKPLTDAAHSQGSRGLMASAMTNEKGEPVTLREVAKKWALGPTIPQIVGTPEMVAAEIERIWRETGCLGFNLSPTTNPDSVHDFVDHVIPLLQKRGVFRTAYEHETLRENLLN